MRRPTRLFLLLSAAAEAARQAPVDAWLAGGAAPATWAIDSAESVAFPEESAARRRRHGNAKEVAVGTYGNRSVVVKRPLPRFEETRVAAEVGHELRFLEALRGRPGVPELLGGWRGDDGLPRYVVAHAGRRLVAGHRRDARLDLTAAYAAHARRDPLGLARRILACFASFADDFFLDDFRPSPSVRRLMMARESNSGGQLP